jgi:hypothetical protein
LCENLGVWVPNGKYTLFLKEEIAAGPDHIFPLFAGGLSKNMKIEKEYAPRSLSAYGLFTCSAGETPFVPIDLYGRALDRIYLDIYDPNGENLNLPNDYPAINACDINRIEACFALRNPKQYLNEEMLRQLLYDLSFKNYPRALLLISEEDELRHAGLLARELQTDRYKTDIAAPVSVLEGADLSDFNEIYYQKESNVFDFESFAENIGKLCARTGPEKAGVLYAARGADINKTAHTVKNVTLKDVYERLKQEKIDKISFDDRTQLCFVSYISDGETHNMLFEDYRSLYAKLNLMQEKGMGKIIFSGLSDETVCACGLMNLLEHKTTEAAV